MPTKMLVALSRFDSSPLSIYLDNNLFDKIYDVAVPPWENLYKIQTPDQVTYLFPTKGPTITFRNLIPIPPLLNLTIISDTSRKPDDLCIK